MTLLPNSNWHTSHSSSHQGPTSHPQSTGRKSQLHLSKFKSPNCGWSAAGGIIPKSLKAQGRYYRCQKERLDFRMVWDLGIVPAGAAREMVDDASVVCEVSLPRVSYPTTHWLTVSRCGYPANSLRLLFVPVLVSQRLKGHCTIYQLTTRAKGGRYRTASIPARLYNYSPRGPSHECNYLSSKSGMIMVIGLWKDIDWLHERAKRKHIG